MAAAGDEGDQQVRPLDPSGVYQHRKLVEAGGDERGHEEVGVVPEQGDGEARAEAPRAVLPGQHDHGDVDQRLEGVEHADGRIEDRGHQKGEDKEARSNQNGSPDPARQGSIVHEHIYGAPRRQVSGREEKTA